jgi:hypothetical protein
MRGKGAREGGLCGQAQGGTIGWAKNRSPRKRKHSVSSLHDVKRIRGPLVWGAAALAAIVPWLAWSGIGDLLFSEAGFFSVSFRVPKIPT